MVEESIHVVFNESSSSLNSGVDVSKIRIVEMSLSDKRKEERRLAYVEIEEIRIKTVDNTEDSVPMQPEPAGTEHLEQEDDFQEAEENLEIQTKDLVQVEAVQDDQYTK